MSAFSFIDEELSWLGIKKKSGLKLDLDDLIGELIIGINNKYSVGILGRIIGVTKTPLCFASPFWHASKGSVCDGFSTDSFVLAWDCLLHFHPNHLLPKIGIFRGVPLFVHIKNTSDLIHTKFTKMKICGKIPPILQHFNETRLWQNLYSNLPRYHNQLKSYINPRVSHLTEQIDIGSNLSSIYKIMTLSRKIQLSLDISLKIKTVETSLLLSFYIKNYLAINLLSALDAWIKGILICKNCGKTTQIGLNDSCIDCSHKIRSQNNIEQIYEQYHDLKKFYSYYNNNVPKSIQELLIYIEIQIRMLIKCENDGSGNKVDIVT